MAMYQAKENGRSRVEFFSDELAKEMAGRAELERELRLALKRDEFLLQFQPQLEVTTGRIVAAEALVRWKHRSEEHTSELQSLMRISYAVFCLKKKKNNEIIKRV